MSGENQKHSGHGDSHHPTNSDKGVTPSETANDVIPSPRHDVALADGDANTACDTGTTETESALVLTAKRDLNSANHDPTGTATVEDHNTVSRDATAASEGVKAVSRDTSAATGGVSAADCDPSAADPTSSATCDREVRVDVEETAETDCVKKLGKDKEEDEELAQLLPHSSKESRGEPGDSALCDGEDDVEVMADMTEDMEGCRENLTQSFVDLQGRAEMGADFDGTWSARKRGITKYSSSLKTFLPIRPKVPKDILPLSSVGCLSFCTFAWVTPIIINIYRKGVDTLKSYRLADIDAAEVNCLRLERLWNEEVERMGPDKASYRRVVFRAFRTRLLCTFVFITFFVFFSLLIPIFLIRSFLEYLSKGDVDIWVGLAYVGGVMVCELMRSLSLSVSWIINYQAGSQIRAGTMTLLYKKIIHLKGLKKKTVGELVNLIGNDSQRIFECLSVGPLVLSGPVAMLGGCTYAVYYLGPWALVGCAIFVGFYPFNTIISKLTTYLRGRGISITDKRVRMMNELLTCIKLIKMYAWEKPFAKKIADIRLEERGILEKSAIIQSISTSTATMVPSMASTLTFIAIVSAGGDLTAAEAFSFVALLNSMRFVLGVLPYGIKALSEVTVALNRYTAVLLMQEMEPVSGPRPPDNMAMEVKDITMTWGSSGDDSPGSSGEKTKKSENREAESRRRNSGSKKDEEKRKMLSDHTTNAMMSENSSEPTTLTNVTFSLPKGKLLGVCGSVGSGKSSLIHAILGRMERVSGSISIGGSLAYVSQQAWILNSTARDNILFGLPYNEQRYNKVVEACALQADFDNLMSGDLTEIGERGINLSGGQKQRISLARALYSDNDIYLLDDPLSAVDIHIGRHIFTNCIMGVLAGKSIIFVTHQLQYLPQCDDIVFLKDGQVSERGHHNSLMAQNGEYATLMRIYYKEHTSELAEEEELDATVELSSSPRVNAEQALSVSSGDTEIPDSKSRVMFERALSTTSKASTVEETGGKSNGAAENAAKAGGKLTAPEEMKQGDLGTKVYLGYMKAAGGYCASFLVFLIFLLFIASQNSSSIFLTYWLNQGSGNTTIQVDNRTVVSQSVTDNPQLSTYTLIYGMTIVAMIAFLFLKAISFMKVSLTAASNMHDDIFAKILRCSMSFFDTTPIGRIVNRFSSDMDEIDVRLPMVAEIFLGNVLYVVFSLGLICFVAPWFLLALLPLVITFVFMYRIFTQTVRDIKRLDMVSRSPLISHLTASVQGITTIYAYAKTKDFLKKYCAMLNTNTVPFVMFFIANRWLALRLDLISITVTTVTGLIIIFTYEYITPAMAGLALASAMQMAGMFQFTVRLAIETEARFTSVQRVLEYSETVTTEAASIIPDKRPGEGWPKKGGIVFNKVQMRYRDNLPLTLKGISFTVNPQEKVGIVGRTGSGKSTLGVVLFRLVELCGGSIIIDDLDISSIGLEDLRSKLSIIPQDPVLFVGTVRYNLDPFSQHHDAQLWAALEKCHIKDTIAGLEQNLDAQVVENGENFSVGERQLLCMARALLRHSQILMLDEATAAIDTETDALIQATLREAFWDCTMLIIAHRLNTVLSCDKILVMDDGKVAQFDRPSVLMSKSESAFRTMLEASEGSGLA